jgi:hypothetical protein
LVVDEVMLAEDRTDYDQLLSKFAYFVVGVFAPLGYLRNERGDAAIDCLGSHDGNMIGYTQVLHTISRSIPTRIARWSAPGASKRKFGL